MEVNVLITLHATREAHFVLLNRDEESITNGEQGRTTDTEREDNMSHEQSSATSPPCLNNCLKHFFFVHSLFL